MDAARLWLWTLYQDACGNGWKHILNRESIVSNSWETKQQQQQKKNIYVFDQAWLYPQSSWERGGIIYQARNKRKSGQVLVPLSLRSRWPLKMDNKDHITKPILAPTAFAQIDLATQNSLPSQWGGRMLTAYITVTQAPSSEMWFLSLWAFFFFFLLSSLPAFRYSM